MYVAMVSVSINTETYNANTIIVPFLDLSRITSAGR